MYPLSQYPYKILRTENNQSANIKDIQGNILSYPTREEARKEVLRLRKKYPNARFMVDERQPTQEDTMREILFVLKDIKGILVDIRDMVDMQNK